MNCPQAASTLLEEISKRNSIVVLSGAGISASAGFPTFIDSKTQQYKTKKKNTFDANVSNLAALGSAVAAFKNLKDAAKG